jgi:hypothetical protein
LFLLATSQSSRIAERRYHYTLDTRIHGFEEYGTDAVGG